jgi:hypothetical protein
MTDLPLDALVFDAFAGGTPLPTDPPRDDPPPEPPEGWMPAPNGAAAEELVVGEEPVWRA